MDTDPLPENDPPGERTPPLSDYLAGEIDALDSMRHGAAKSRQESAMRHGAAKSRQESAMRHGAAKSREEEFDAPWRSEFRRVEGTRRRQ